MGDPMSKVIGTLSNGTGVAADWQRPAAAALDRAADRELVPGMAAASAAARTGGGGVSARRLFTSRSGVQRGSPQEQVAGTVVLKVVVEWTGRRTRSAYCARWEWDWTRRRSKRRGCGASTRMKDGRPVPVEVNMEINFHLY